ncbi:carboxylesterase/lipase family protein [Flavobacterium sp. W21_SRS_FM6]|uniref:carboxylesterase/lipase family protein n=1 Tax=Flavobacterium sp. W21_SRS_FM6 TaxID=3240268 RepID=UPI003F8F5F44
MRQVARIFIMLAAVCLSACEQSHNEVEVNFIEINQGRVKGHFIPQLEVVSFKGIPYAQAPVGDRRWQAPLPATKWRGVLNADDFAHKCMQNPLFSDMQFRASGMSEDCLFLNIWAPQERTEQKFPVLVYFYGGGFIAGDGSENRYDGADMASNGILTVTVNYRLGVFGFMAHPQLSSESAYAGSGNYGLLDQQAALIWVAQNIAAFGGDPKRITIAGESAGSISASAQTLSAKSIPHIHGVIGESGSIMGRFVSSLAQSESQGLALAEAVLEGEDLSIAALRALPADELLKRATQAGYQQLLPTIDGKFLTDTPQKLFETKKFADVPVLAGVNSQEGSYQQLFGEEEVTQENYLLALQKLYPDNFRKIAALYSGESTEELKRAAQDLMSDRFISESTWKWINAATTYGSADSYYYLYDHIRPAMKSIYNRGQRQEISDMGAVHSAEIEYVLGNLDTNPIYEWEKEDFEVSTMAQQYFINFIKSGNPNGEHLLPWPKFNTQQQLVIKLEPFITDLKKVEERYLGLSGL